MKKLLKVVALATVMCMLLSSAAFASFGTATGDKETKVISATVTNAGANEQVVLLIVNAGVEVAEATDAAIMYIDQKQADASGNATFNNILIKDVEQKVDVYVGSAETDGPKLLGENIDLSEEEVTGIVLAAVERPVITVEDMVEGGGMRGFAAAITVAVPEGLEIEKMIWGFEIDEGESPKKFSKAIANPVSANVSGNVQFAAAFDLATLSEGFGDVTDVSAIFLTSDGAEHFTDPTDAAKEKKPEEIPAE